MKGQWVLVVARSLAAVGAPPASTAAGDEIRSSYEQAGRWVETAFGYYREALAIEPRHLGASEYLGEFYLVSGEFASAAQCLGAMRTLDRLEKSLASAS